MLWFPLPGRSWLWQTGVDLLLTYYSTFIQKNASLASSEMTGLPYCGFALSII